MVALKVVKYVEELSLTKIAPPPPAFELHFVFSIVTFVRVRVNAIYKSK